MDVWVIARDKLENDLLTVFSELDGLQYRFDWLISDHDMWYSPNCPEEIKKRWQWTGLLMTGQELTNHYAAGYVQFFTGGILSAVPLGTKPEQVWDYIPTWEEDYENPDYRFQTPLTQLELICFDGYAWMIVCNSEFSKVISECLPMACSPKDFYNR